MMVCHCFFFLSRVWFLVQSGMPAARHIWLHVSVFRSRGCKLTIWACVLVLAVSYIIKIFLQHINDFILVCLALTHSGEVDHVQMYARIKQNKSFHSRPAFKVKMICQTQPLSQSGQVWTAIVPWQLCKTWTTWHGQKLQSKRVRGP